MTDVRKREVPYPVGSNAGQSINALVETVNMLQGTNDQQQRAVRVFEFEQSVAAIEARLKKAGF